MLWCCKFLPLNLLPDKSECKQGMRFHTVSAAASIMDTPEFLGDKTKENYRTIGLRLGCHVWKIKVHQLT